MHLTTSPIDWYAARAAGVVAYLLLSVVVTLGVTMAGRVRLTRWPRFAIEEVHRLGGILVGSFVVIHVLTIAIDAYLPFPVASLVVPGVGSYRPLWVAFGIVAAELLLALAFTNHYRNRFIPYAAWRRIHYVNLVVWVAATVHGIASGTDRDAVWLLAVYAAAASAVAGAIVWRFGRVRTLAVAVGLATGAAVIGLEAGPLGVPHPHWNEVRFSGPMQGASDSVGDPSQYNTFMISGVGGGGQQVWFRADVLMLGRIAQKGSSFEMAYLPSGKRCHGSVRNLGSADFVAVCRLRTGATRRIEASWHEGPAPGALVGRISVRPVRPG